MQHRFSVWARTLLLLILGSSSAFAATLDEQRQQFLAAHESIMQDDPVDVQSVIARLQGYVLAPYLEYFHLQRQLDKTTRARIVAFLEKNNDLPVSGLLRTAYLQRLAQRGAWSDFESLYRPSASVELRCHALHARLKRNAVDKAWLDEAITLWLVGRSQPAVCDPVFDALYAREAISADQVWKRVTLLIEGGQDRLAEQFKARLDPARREWLEYWLASHRRPRQLLEKPGFPLVGPYAAQVIVHALHRLSRSDPAAARGFLEQYRHGKLLTATQRSSVARHIALQAAYSQDPGALAWLDELPQGAVNDPVRLWTARMALRNQDWPRLLAAIVNLPEGERRSAQWRYWRAHALAATDQQQQAQIEFTMLALERNYYGFLAADRLALPYSLNHIPTAIADGVLQQVMADPGIVRAREFYQLDMLLEARREWHAAMARLSREQQAQAAMLALQWGWYDNAVLTANRAGLSNDLDLRFPTPYREMVERYSRLNQLDPHITYAIVRKESAFRSDAASAVGALGLMQVMPQTGKQVARQLNVELSSRAGLFDIDTNLNLGSAYLREMLDRYDGSLVLAAAAYNAGPARVEDWLERNAGLPPAVWIEAISFHETREYVKSILAFTAVFEWQLNGKSGRLSRYLLPFGSDSGCSEGVAGC
jgi:soluble lytic murein transglycosylase